MTDQTDTSPAEEAREPEDERAALWRRMQDDEGKEAGAPAEEARAAKPAGEASETPQEHTEGQETPPPAEKVAGEKTEPEDIWAEAPDPLRKAYKELEEKFTRETKRQTALQRELHALRSRQSPAPAQPQQRQEQRPAQQDADPFAPLKDDYPEIHAPLSQARQADLRELAKLRNEVQQLNAAETRRMQQLVDKEESLLTSEHSDWLTLLETHQDEFTSFVHGEDIPKGLYDKAMRNKDQIANAHEAAEVIAAFKRHIGKGPEPSTEPPAETGTAQNQLSDKRRRQKEATSAVASSSGRATVSGIPENATREQIWAAWAKQGL